MFEKLLYRPVVAVSALAVIAFASVAGADSFGTGDNVFEIDFVTISGSTNPTMEQASAGDLDGFGIVNDDYRIGMHETTNDQWNKFVVAYGAVTGDPMDDDGDWPSAYGEDPYYTGTDVPTNNVSWYEAAQFVNWLNTSSGHQAAYKFTGTQGTIDYTPATWSAAEAAGGTNLYRHKNAFYFLPTEDEWVKAAYWNGSDIQDYATKPGDTLHQGDGTNGTGWNYADHGPATDPPGPWNVGSGSEELNGTYDMMGNVMEWMESPSSDINYGILSNRGNRAGHFGNNSFLAASFHGGGHPSGDSSTIGFRVASIPEPGSITLLACGATALLACTWRQRRRA